MLLFVAQNAMAFSIGSRGPQYGLQNSNMNMYNTYSGNGMGATGEGVGEGFLSCGCAEQILTNNIIKGGLCDNYSRLHVNAITNQGAVIPGMAPASPAAHQLPI